MLFKIENFKAKRVTLKDFAKERDLQTIVEKNLEEIFGLEFLTSEFPVDNCRFDTLAYDESNNTFIIIEYKKNRNTSLVDQGYTYLNVSTNRKADIVLLFNRVKNVNKDISDFDWSSMRVYFVSPMFTDYQKGATNNAKLPFKLFEANNYGDGLLMINEIKPTQSNDVSSKNDSNIAPKEIEVYDENYHTSYFKDDGLIELYEILKARILQLPDVTMDVKKSYIAFKKRKGNICDVIAYKDHVRIFINLQTGQLVDKLNLAVNIQKSHNGNGDYYFVLKKEEDIEYLMTLIRQSYDRNKY